MPQVHLNLSEKMQQGFLRGCLLVALANSFVSVNIVCNKYLVNSVPISVLLELRYFFGALVLWVALFFTKKKFQFYLSNQKFSIKDTLVYLLMALTGGAVFNAIYMYGMKSTTAIATGMIASTIPLLVVFLSFLFLKQKLRGNHFISAIFVTIGICILNFGIADTQRTDVSETDVEFGNFIVFIAMISEALFPIFAKMITKPVSPMMSAFMINGINLLVCTPFFLFQLKTFSLSQLSTYDIFLSFLIGFFSGALFFALYNNGITKINAQTAGLLTGVVPISTTLLSVILLREPFGMLALIGMLFVLGSIYIGVYSNPKRTIL